MPKRFIHSDNFLRGLQTTRGEDGKPLPEFETFQNVRVGTGVAKRRGGIRRVSRATATHTSLTFDGATQYISIPPDSRAHNLKKSWTLEVLAKPTGISGDHYILGQAGTVPPFTIRVNVSGNVVATVRDSAAATTTLTSSSTYTANTVLAIQLVRDGTALTLRVNGAQEATGTMADLNLDSWGSKAIQVGAHNTGSYFLGGIDYVRCYAIVLASQANAKIRCVSPRAPYVLFDYPMVADANARVLDQGRYGATGLAVNSPSSGTTLCHPTMPVTMIAPRLARDGQQTLTVHAGNSVYDAVLD